MREWKDQLSMKLHREEIDFMLNEDGQILGITDLVMEITGLHRNEIIKNSILEIVEEESREKLKKSINGALDGISQIVSIRFTGTKSDSRTIEGKLMRIGSIKEKMLLLLLRGLD